MVTLTAGSHLQANQDTNSVSQAVCSSPSPLRNSFASSFLLLLSSVDSEVGPSSFNGALSEWRTSDSVQLGHFIIVHKKVIVLEMMEISNRI